MKYILKYTFIFVIIFLFTHPIFAAEKEATNPDKSVYQTTVQESATILSSIKEFLLVLQPAVTVLAIIIGGIWTYMLFVQRRQKYPRADITHDITHISLTGNKIWLHLDITLTNIGDVLLSFASAEFRIQQVLPLSPDLAQTINEGKDPVEEELEIGWPIICNRVRKWKEGAFEIEPGESDHVYFDCIVDSKSEVIEVYSHFQNIKKGERDIGWPLTTIYDLRFRNNSENNPT